MPEYNNQVYSWLELHYQHKAQSNALAADFCILMSGGMNIAWGLYYSSSLQWNKNILHLIISWFIGNIIGSILSLFFVQRYTKNYLYYTSGLLIIIDGILFISLPNNNSTLLIGRYLNGIAVGFVSIQTFVTGGEVSIKLLRGVVISSEKIAISLGICFQTFFVVMGLYENSNGEEDGGLTSNRLHGIILIILGIFAILSCFGFPIESPVFVLQKRNENDALTALMRLHRMPYITNEIYEICDDFKKMIEEDNEVPMSTHIQNTKFILIKLIVFRLVLSLATSIPIYLAFIVSSSSAFESDGVQFLYIPAISSFVGTIIAVFLIDSIGRRRLSMCSLGLGGILLLCNAIIFTEPSWLIQKIPMMISSILLIVYQFTIGLTALVSSVYLSEAFPFSLKRFAIFTVLFCENFLQILICVIIYCTEFNPMSFFIFCGVIYLIESVLVKLLLPETKLLSLRECQSKFLNSSL